MMEVRRQTTATPKEVFDVLGDGWLYPSWVVGASRMREVDDAWPAEGSRVHHSFGAWPALIDDVSEVLVNEAPHRLVLRAKGWPLGEATVEVRIDEWAGGSLVTLMEDATRGPGTLVPKALRQPVIAFRNRETVRRLILLAEGRAGKGHQEAGRAGD